MNCDGWEASIWQKARQGDLKSILYLVESFGEDCLNLVDDGGRSVLHYAVDGMNLNVVEYLIEQGVDVNLKDEDGATPLDYLDIQRSFIERILYEEQTNTQLQQLNNIRDILIKNNASNGSGNPFIYKKASLKGIIRDKYVSRNDMDSKFWKHKPMKDTSNSVKNILDNLLPKNVEWIDNSVDSEELFKKVFDLTCSEESGILPSFGIQYSQSFDVFKNYLNSSSCWEGLQEKETGKIIGFIAAKKHTYSLNEKIHDCVEVHSLVLHPDYRGIHLTPILIQKLHIQTTKKWNVHIGFYTTLSILPIEPLSVCKIFYKLLRPVNMKGTPFFYLSEFQTMAQYCLESKIPDIPKYTFEEYTDSHATDVFNIAKVYYSQFPIHLHVESPEEFNKTTKDEDVCYLNTFYLMY